MGFKDLTPTGRIEHTEIYALEDMPNSLYFMKLAEGWLVVDAGTHVEVIQAGMKELGIVPEEVRYVLLTHSDHDHVAGVTMFPKAEIYASKGESDLMFGKIPRNESGGYNSLPSGIDTGQMKLLRDGEQLEFEGHEIQCIALPGHTPGSMGYLVDEAYLFTGDAVGVDEEGKLILHPYTMNETLAEASIKKLVPYLRQSRLLLTAHFGVFETAKLLLAGE